MAPRFKYRSYEDWASKEGVDYWESNQAFEAARELEPTCKMHVRPGFTKCGKRSVPMSMHWHNVDCPECLKKQDAYAKGYREAKRRLPRTPKQAELDNG